MAKHICVGTSGWNYEHWKGRFYPVSLPQTQWLEYYSRSFKTVEINSSFYRQPDKKSFESWRRRAPKDFRYAVKANRYLTHMCKLKVTGSSLKTFLSGARLLKSTLGPILYQLPPRWNKNLDRLDAFVRQLPGDLTHVIEFREKSWLSDDTFELLNQHNVSLCVHDMIQRHPRRVTGKVAYVRFHGAGPKKYSGKYRPSRLKSWAQWLRGVAKDKDVYVYFNNDDNAYAIRDAGTFEKLIKN